MNTWISPLHQFSTAGATAWSHESMMNQWTFLWGVSIEDVNECTVQGTTRKCIGEDKRCRNYPGTYRCNCISPGQQLDGSESTCIGMYIGTFTLIICFFPNFFSLLLKSHCLKWLFKSIVLYFVPKIEIDKVS
jgi:hypothetical protein